MEKFKSSVTAEEIMNLKNERLKSRSLNMPGYEKDLADLEIGQYLDVAIYHANATFKGRVGNSMVHSETATTDCKTLVMHGYNARSDKECWYSPFAGNDPDVYDKAIKEIFAGRVEQLVRLTADIWNGYRYYRAEFAPRIEANLATTNKTPTEDEPCIISMFHIGEVNSDKIKNEKEIINQYVFTGHKSEVNERKEDYEGNLFQTNCIACGADLKYKISSKAGQLCQACRYQGMFRKEIIITGITRMNSGNICVSGIDPITLNFVRPVFSIGLTRDFVMEGSTQMINHFNLVEIEFKRYNPDKEYHTEDWIINENYAPRFKRHLTDKEILEIVNKVAITNLNRAIEKKNKSLFIVKVKSIGNIWHEQFEKFKVRIDFEDFDGNFYSRIPVTDLLTLAFVRYQLNIGNKNYSYRLINTFNNNPYRFIRIGLTREWGGQHWKQVTALITVPDIFDGKSFSYYESKIGGEV